MNLPLAQIRRTGLRLIATVMMVDQLVFHCVNTMVAPRKMTNVLRCHVQISIRPFTMMSPLSLLRDTQLVLNTHLTPFGSTTNLRAIVRRSWFCWSRSIQIKRSSLLASKSIATATVPTSMAMWSLSTQIAQIFPDSHPGYHARFSRGQPDICCRNVAKSQTWNGKKLFNDVDITHTERYFSLRYGHNLEPKDRRSSMIVPNVRLKIKLWWATRKARSPMHPHKTATRMTCRRNSKWAAQHLLPQCS